MPEPQIRYDDGATYERYMAPWSQVAGGVFLDWLAPQPGWRWIDVGCGTGAFAELVVSRHAPAELQGIDPSSAQLDFARSRPGARMAEFRQGEAGALPFPDDRFDAAVMALVIFFVPDPVKGVAEMVRVVRPGGMVAAYAWDILGGGFPFEPVFAELRARDLKFPLPPSSEAARLRAMQSLWTGAGLEAVETFEITVQRSFTNFDAYWSTAEVTGAVKPILAAMTAGEVDQLKAGVCARLPADVAGRVTCSARANAAKGRVPG